VTPSGGRGASREKKRFACGNCGFVSPKWLGRCSDCGAWNSLVEEAVTAAPRRSGPPPVPSTPLSEISARGEDRTWSGSEELDRVLGGGLVAGSVVLLGGDPGIGKTTLLLESLGRLSREQGVTVLYASGEESPRQIRMRAERLGIEGSGLLIYTGTTIEGILEEAERVTPSVLVVDSVQTMTSERIESAAGSVSQVRQVAGEVVPFAKSRDLPVFLVGHVTKDGALAGPRVLEHMVDTVLYFEGENTRDYRILRSIKNRFGSTNEIGIFEMSDRGLKGVDNPSRLFLRSGEQDVAGSVITASLEGTRPFLVEIQALTADSGFSSPRRGCSGADPSRFAMLVAVLEKKIGLGLQDQDIYLNLTGGIRIVEPAADAGILAAIASSFSGKPADHGAVVFGEIGLTGEIRAVVNPERRLREAAKLGFRRCLLPASSLGNVDSGAFDIQVEGVSQAQELVEKLCL
jgi:DNA repair protein RadA/Sms